MPRDPLRNINVMLGVVPKKSTVEKGRNFELRVRRVLEKRGYKEFSRPHDKHCDWICEDRQGNKVYVECKASPKAKFSKEEVAYLTEKSRKHKVLIAYKDENRRTQIVPLRKFLQHKKAVTKKKRKTKSKAKTKDIFGFKTDKLKLW